MLKKFNWFRLTNLITLVLLMWKWMGLFLRKNQLLRCWDWLLNWIGAKIASRKIGALIRSMKFLSPEVAWYLYKPTIRPCMEYFCHVGAGAPCCYLLSKLQKWICRAVGPCLASSSKCSQLKSFLMYYFGRCSSELTELVALPYSRGKSTCYSDRWHYLSRMLQGCLCQQFLSSHR